MSQDTGILDKSFIASTDLRTKQYYIVKMLQQTGSTPYSVTLATGSDQSLLGVLQNKPNIGETAVVRMLGTSKMIVKAAVRTGSPLSSYSDGVGSPVVGDKLYVIAMAMEDASSDGDIIEVMITHFKNSV